MFWLKKAAPSEPLAVAMSGVKLGNRLLVVGCGDGKLVAQLALKTGLTGRACALDQDAARSERAQATATREGALIESFTAPWTDLPFGAAAFDIVVIRDALATLDRHRRTAMLGEVFRVLRPGGRAIVIERAARGGLAALIQGRAGSAEYAASGGALRALTSAGFRGARVLADRDGLAFVEGMKPAAA